MRTEDKGNSDFGHYSKVDRECKGALMAALGTQSFSFPYF